MLGLNSTLRREFAVTTLVDADVHDDGTLLHALHRVFRDDDRSHLARDEG